MMLAALLLVGLSTTGAPYAEGVAARVEVLEGRAFLAGSGVVVRLQAGDPERWIDGAAHLELSADARARVTWSGHASLLLEGRHVLEWRSGEVDGTPAWEWVELGRAHLELRRGPLDLGLPGAWGARLFSGAAALRGLPGGGVEIDHQAGLPFDLWPPQRGDAPSAPFTVLAGARMRLLAGTERPLALAGSSSRLREAHQQLGFERRHAPPGFPAWRGFAWPWSSALPATPIDAALPERAVPELPESLAVRFAPAAVATPAALAEEPAVEPTEEVAEAPSDVESAPAPARTRPVREQGVLVLTPYGPRWLDASRAVDPALRAAARD